MSTFHKSKSFNLAKLHKAVNTLKIFENPQANKVFKFLAERYPRKVPVIEIFICLKVPQTVVSSALRLLRKGGFVDYETQGKFRLYYVKEIKFEKFVGIVKRF